MSTPIIIVSGKAGSGKDTVAAYIADKYNGVCIAQADPMKRFVKNLMGFSDNQLWGPSEARNTRVPQDFFSPKLSFRQAAIQLHLDVFGFPIEDDDTTNFFSGLRSWYDT